MTNNCTSIPIYYHSAGQGKPLLLIHGWAMNSRVWASFKEAFCAQYRVITLDLRGHGNSRDIPGPYNFNTFAQDVLQIIEGLALTNTTLIGWSMGVSVILKLFENPPSAVDSLVFISGTPSLIAREGYPHGVSRGAVHSLSKQIKKDYKAGMINFYDRMFQGKDLVHADKERIYSLVVDTGSIPQQTVVSESLKCLQQEDIRPSLRNIEVPTLIIHGALDPICLPGAAQYMAAHINKAALSLIADTGHVPFLTEQEQVHKTINGFIRNLQ
jgi:pimeloyl-[acyl-carrier protein] methyl ester esterase